MDGAQMLWGLVSKPKSKPTEMVPTYDGLIYDFSTLRWCKIYKHAVKITLWVLNLDFFPG